MSNHLAAVEGQPCECGRVVPDGEHHCLFHHVDEHPEALDVYRVCFECGHVWTKRALVRAYRKALRELAVGESIWGDDFRPSRLRTWWRILTVRVTSIHFCQECIHDW